MNRTRSKLYLIPTPVYRQKDNQTLPEYTLSVARSLSVFVVEKVQPALSFLQWIDHPMKDFELTLRVLNKKTPDHEVAGFLKLFEQGDVGLMSDAGAPAVADPGSKLVKLAHERGIEVIPLTGPSSILLALMGSGLEGQRFSFDGYLPLDDKKRVQRIQDLEKRSLTETMTQIIMETPHRNHTLFELLLSTLELETHLCVACNLTAPDGWIRTSRVYEWQQQPQPDLQQKPALYLIFKSS